MKTKSEFREYTRNILAALSPAEIMHRSKLIREQAVTNTHFKSSSVIFIYLAVSGEVRTDDIIETAWQQGKTVCVPAAQTKNTYAPARLEKDTTLRSGIYGVREPADPVWVPLPEIQLVFAPGLAFGKNGGRIGHGGGHYDRMLKNNPSATLYKIGMAFREQLFDTVPTNKHDVLMDEIITD